MRAYMNVPRSMLPDIKRQGMNVRDQIGTKGRMDCAVALHTVHWGKRRVPNCHTEMRLPRAVIARMTCVAVAVIHDIQLLRAESGV